MLNALCSVKCTSKFEEHSINYTKARLSIIEIMHLSLIGRVHNRVGGPVGANIAELKCT